MNTRMTVVIGVLGALALRSGSPAHATPPGDACSLLTQAQVNAALGAEVATVAVGSDAKHCHWLQEGKHKETLVDAHLLLEAARTYDTAKNAMGMSGKVTRVSVSGVGDDAYYLVGRRDAPLFAKKGDAALRIAVDGKGWSAEEIKNKEKALALAVLAKL
jgi:hypothetical protein